MANAESSEFSPRRSYFDMSGGALQAKSSAQESVVQCVQDRATPVREQSLAKVAKEQTRKGSNAAKKKRATHMRVECRLRRAWRSYIIVEAGLKLLAE